ncbi:MAG: PKD domain-containing protein [Bacteroidetes bacterium]|nr:PKD domain-containing protein [Bacteroidota bacterium]
MLSFYCCKRLKFSLVKTKVLVVFLFLSQQLFATNYYSYQSGLWNNLTTWTTDPSGTTLVGSAVPANTDNVTILDGKTVTLSANVTTIGNSINIKALGVLNISTFQITNTLTSLSGSGLLRIASSTFPTATTNTFVASGGGTTEYYNFGGAGTNLPTQAIYNNLILSNSTVSNATLRFNNPSNPTNYTINGNLTISRSSSGTLTLLFGNATTNVINASVGGNTTIGNGCSMRVGNFNAIHNLSFNGDFTNNGTVRFTNQTSPVVNAYYTAAITTTGAANVTFTGTSNNTLSCNGITDFYVFKLNKGIDQTYTLTVNSTNTANFALYGPNNGASPTKAFYLIAGTIKLNANINIPSLTEGGIDFGIPETCALWINGATVSTTIVGLNGTGYQALSVFGQVRVSDGSMSSGDAAGLVCWSSNSPEIIVEGSGVLDVSQIWTTAAIGTETYIQTGGTTNIRANGEVHGGPMFQFNSSSSVVNISGGTLNFINGIFTAGQGIDIQCAPGNYSITGGTININEPSGTNFGINSTIPFYDVNISRQSGGATSTVTLLNTSASTIVVQNDLVLNANTLLDAGTNTVNLTVGGNFTLIAASTYTPGNTSTNLNGAAAQLFSNNGTITSGMYNFTISKTSGTATLAGTAAVFTVRNNLSINAGTLADGGKIVDVKGNVINSGTHTGLGKITLSGTTTQTIGGSGNGMFQNIELNNTNAASAPISLLSNQTINGTLSLTSNKIFDIGVYNLSLGASATIAGATGASRFIRTAGFRSDGGLSKSFSTTTFTFPLGTALDYTPATITLSTAPTSYGSVTMRPVASEHPNVTVSGRSLTYYWRTTSSGFVLGAATVLQNYTYPQADVVVGGTVTEAGYVPAKFNATSLVWSNTTSADINTGTNVITFQGPTFNTSIDGDFTAGDNNPTNPFGAVLVYYSRVNSGNWESAASWSVDQVLKWGGAASATVPTAASPVVIGNGSTYNHTITVTANAKVCGSVEIGQGSILNLGTTTGHNFNTYMSGAAVGKGTLRISSAAATAQFPAGDFGLFLGNPGGTVEYFNTAAQDFTIPVTSNAPSSVPLANYYKLVLSPTTGRTITLPNRDLTIYNNLEIKGASATARALINGAATQNLTVNANLIVTSGNLQFQNVNLQNLTIVGDVNVLAGAIFDVANAGAGVNNSLTINGNLSNNGIFDMRTSATRLCNVVFTGSANTSITGTTGTLTEFNLISVDKGTNQTPVLNVDVAGTLTTLSDSWLTLINGTFQFSKAATLTLTNVGGNTFSIPPTAMLSVNNSAAFVNIGYVGNDGADLLLAGKLKISSGTVFVGNTANANNNDIEYSGAGFPEIELLGGTLHVNGQIRKSIISTAGSLVYKQSGNSAVIIYGQNQLATKSKLQINSPGSVFNMSGTSTLTLIRGGGTTYQDLYLQAASSTVSGGTIQLGNTSTPAGTTFLVNCINPLYNLVIDATTTTKTAQLAVNALQLGNDLTINGNSVFNTNGLAVTIGRNLLNNNTSATIGLSVGGYRPITANQTTTFNSALANQTISGLAGNLTNFSNLVIANTFLGGIVSASTNTAVRVNSTLTISSGVFSDGANSIDVVGNIVNNSTHTSSGAGRLNLVGTSNQSISGNGLGVFGNLTLNNTSGATMLASSTINGTLNFNVNCTFNINDRLLTFGTAATIVGFNASRYIETNGVATDLGVRKNFNSGAGSFTFAVGVLPKYTPATITLTTNTAAGNITVKPINSKHPGTTDALAKELAFYWNVTSTGFAGVTANHTYTYVQSDVFGTEANYVTGRNLSGLWTPLNGIPATVNTVSNTLSLTGVNYLLGDFTAGEASEFAAPLTYYSRVLRTSNNWNNTSGDTWSTDPVLQHNGPAVGTFPSTFNAVSIAASHTIIANGDFRKCATLNLQGTLDLSNNVGHDLGVVSGTGVLKIASTPSNFYALPSGNFSAFVASGAGTFEFSTATSATLPLIAQYNNLSFTGSGTSILANTDLVINGNLNNSAGTIDNSVNNRNIDLYGNWTNTGISFIPGTGTLSLKGSGTQTLMRTGGEQLYNLTIGGSGTKMLGSSIMLNNDLVLNSSLDADVLGNYSIDIKGNWSNTGTFIPQQGEVSFVGNTAQTINGSTTFFDLTINNTSGGVSILGGAQNMAGGLDLVSGTFITTGQSFTLLSSSSATARIKPVTGGNLIGNVTMQRYLPTTVPGWFLLGSPLQNTVIEDWDDNLVTSGFPGSDGSAAGFISIYNYDETVGGTLDNPSAYLAATNSTNTTPIGKGFWIWLADDLVSFSGRAIDVVGPPMIGSVNLNVSYTNSAGISNDGWNLISNPYCSTIDWNDLSWTKTNMDNATYIYHGTNQQYASYVAGVGTNGGSQFIPSSQGFYVKANAAAPVLIAQETVKSAANPAYLKTSAASSTTNSELLYVRCVGNNFEDETALRFNNNATMGFDSEWDAVKLFSDNPQNISLSTRITNQDYSINSIPSGYSTLQIPLRTKVGVSGTYTLTFSGISNFSGFTCISLEDTYTGISTDLKAQNVYTVQLSDTSDKPQYVIHFTKVATATAIPTLCGTGASGKIILEGAAGSSYTLSNPQGSILYSTTNFSGLDTLGNLTAGSYLLLMNDSASQCQTLADTIEVLAGPSLAVSFVSSALVAIPGQLLSFTNQSFGATTYSWVFGDSSAIATSANPTHSYLSPGQYVVTLSASNNYGCTKTSSIAILIQNPTTVQNLAYTNGINILTDELGNYLQYSFTKNTNVSINCYNALGEKIGKTIHTTLNNQGIFPLELSASSKGFYTVELLFDGQKRVQKIIR